MLREELQHISQTARDVRKFGVTIGSVLVLLAVVLWWKEKPSASAYALAGVLFSGVTWLMPNLMRPLYRAWMTLALLMGFVMTRVLLTVLFFGLFTPIAVIARLVGKDLLQERFAPGATSYWVKRSSRAYEPQQTERMF